MSAVTYAPKYISLKEIKYNAGTASDIERVKFKDVPKEEIRRPYKCLLLLESSPPDVS